MNDKIIKVSVRNLVEFIYRSGDLDSSFNSISRAQEGTKIHQMLQKSLKSQYKESENTEFHTELSLKHSFNYKDLNFLLEGRADGILIQENKVTIIEIKSTQKDLISLQPDYNFLHWAQAKCYGFIYARQQGLESISIELMYCNVESYEVKSFIEEYNMEELERFFHHIMEKYIHWANYTSTWLEIRNESIKKLEFPFKNYRNGQRDLAINVYRTIKEGKKLYAQAPTGIGKTMSTCFPSIKALGEGYGHRIFYLTAKTITRTVAEQSLKLLRNNGLKVKSTTITAKEKICFKENCECNPEYCEYARGHFDRVNEALFSALENEDSYSREVIEEYSKKYSVCPFEFSLDLTLWSDLIICDYNYVFDPRVSLKRFFIESNEDFIFLVDEAHNLVDRAREMFSAEVTKEPILNLKKNLKDSEPKIYKQLNKLNTYMVKLRSNCDNKSNGILEEAPKDLFKIAKDFLEACDNYLAKNEEKEFHEELLDLYFNFLAFMRISEYYCDDYVSYVEREGQNIKLKLFCLNPRDMIKNTLKKGKATIFFSATLSPIQYFKELLGGEEDDYSLKLKSPFPEKNKKIIIGNEINTRYNYREFSYDNIVTYIHNLKNLYKGNYMIFFPSYSYMMQVYNKFVEKYSSDNIIIQNINMSEEDREEFLSKFYGSCKNVIGFCVLGGIFSEGIDLVGESLIGTIIVGVGLPQVCFERELIQKYFNKYNNLGFHYAYTFPGINKVIQGAGRVIRTEEDKGIIFLLDDRYTSELYKKIIPEEWFPYTTISNVKELEAAVDEFKERSMD